MSEPTISRSARLHGRGEGCATSCDQNSVDPGIADLVRELNAEEGIRTIGSCEGGLGHAFAVPTVQLRSTHLTPERIRSAPRWLQRFTVHIALGAIEGRVRRVMKRRGEACTVSKRLLVQGSGRVMAESYVELELW